MTYVVVDVGCLECRVESEVLGIYPDLDSAHRAHPDAALITTDDDVRGTQTQKQILAYEE